MSESSNTPQEHIAKIQKAIEQAEALRGVLPVDQVETILAPLKASLAQFHAQLSGSGAIAQSGGTAVGAGGVNVGGNAGNINTGVSVSVVNNQYVGADPTNEAEAKRIYLEATAQMVSRLPLRTFDASQSNPNAPSRELSLINVYTALDTTESIQYEEKRNRNDEQEIVKRSRPLRAIEAVASHAPGSLVLLGEPGSGKSTFAHHLMYCLALGLDVSIDLLPEKQTQWPQMAHDLMPIRVILRDFDAWLGDDDHLPRRADVKHLHDFIAHTLEQANLAFAMPLLARALESGHVMLVLDGLDEVTSVQKRKFVRDAILSYKLRYPKICVLVTCRTWSYQPPDEGQEDLRLHGFHPVELAPFDDEKIDAFIQAWHAELVRAGKLTQAQADHLQPRLAQAVHRRDLRRLAGNPLQLTLMAWVHTDEAELPDKRAKLYERAVDLLLWKWEVQKRDDGRTRTLRDLAGEIENGKDRIERELWRAAFDAHARLSADEQRDNPDKLADVSELALKKALARLKLDGQNKPDENWARDVADAIKERSGLLTQRLPDTLTFPHRTFQEYLAGLWLLQERFVAQASELANQFDVWREVILLAVGHSVYVKKDYDLEKPLALVRELCPLVAREDDDGWRRIWLAGEVLAEAGVTQLSELNSHDTQLVQTVREHLARLVEEGKLSASERAQTGVALSRIGDPRFNPQAWFLPNDDALGFIRVPSESLKMGTRASDFDRVMDSVGIDKKDRDMWRDEVWPDDAPDLTLSEFYVGRYLVTVAQFKAFVQATGLQPGDPDCLRDEDNHPVRYVSWHEAMAYGDWLTKKLLGWNKTPKHLHDLLSSGAWRVTLPTEAEWEKAARGPIQGNPNATRIFTWGDEMPPNHGNEFANMFGAGIGTTCCVGAFPRGESITGCRDLMGNVWEWTRSLWEETTATNEGDSDQRAFTYPYDPGDGRENDANQMDQRVVRGGAFFLDEGDARCAYRSGVRPDGRNYDLGFRGVVSPISL
jgi:formylglycine-generating enzyme required for sulfatase activity